MGRVKKSKQNKQAQKSTNKSTSSKNDQQIQRIMMYTGIGVIAIALVFVVLSMSQGTQPEQFDLSGQPSLGEPNAPVKVVEFGDWKCPACKRFHDIAFEQLKSDYIDTGQVEFYFVNFPIPNVTGPDSTNAALASECIYAQSEQDFWEFYDVIYENQGIESEIWATPEFLAEQVERFVNPDIDREAFISCINEGEHQELVDADFAMGREAGVNGTPTIFVNGMLSRSSYGALSSDIERALEEE